MKILKFGGTSVGSAAVIKKVHSIVKQSIGRNEDPIVVVSAFSGVTNLLLKAGRAAASGSEENRKIFSDLKELHIQTIRELIPPDKADDVLHETEPLFTELEKLIYGIYLIRELSLKSKDQLMSYGEQLSAKIISRSFSAAGVDSEYFDAREVIVTDNSFGNAKVNFEVSDKLISEKLGSADKLMVVTGFIARTADHETTTLGRGGSDYTASILGAALGAEEIQIWTDVDGFMTADPRKVKKALPIESLSYDEALEMTHFGAKVVYPPTIRPAYIKSVPIVIKNTFNPSSKGTSITGYGANKNFLITGISLLADVALIKIEGNGLSDTSGVTGRIYSLLAKLNVPVILASQASAGNSICFCIPASQADQLKTQIESELKYELHYSVLDNISLEHNVSLIAVIAENMRNNSSIPGRIFESLGTNGVTIYAIAQGSSQLNLSLVVSKSDEIKALNVIHDEFFLSDKKTVNLFIAGTGLIGRTLFQQIKNQKEFLSRHLRLEIKIAGLANSRKMLIDENGIDIDQWEDVLSQKGETSVTDTFMQSMKKCNLSNTVFVDCTSSEEIIRQYPGVLCSSIPIVTPNKQANTSEYSYYQKLRELAKQYNVRFLYETNVGAGLPVISTLNDLMLSGDKVIRIEGILSGTLSYLFNNFTEGTSFSALLRDAVDKGYTEPDPREDLTGTDVARKLLILIREAGYKAELKDIEIEGLLPSESDKNLSKEEFLKTFSQYDGYFRRRLENAGAKGCRLRYIASWEDGKASVKLTEVPEPHPFYALASNDNIISFKTVYYKERPVVIQGPGAGATVTSGGVLADIIRIANYHN